MTPDAPIVTCQERNAAVPAEELQSKLTDDDEPVIYCAECWAREFGES